MKTNWFNSKRIFFFRNIGLALLALIVGGCPAGKQSAEPAPSAKVVIRGSNTIGEELAPRLIAAYKRDHTNVVFDLESKGTGYGMGNLLVGGCDIAAASREANTNELALAKDRNVDLNDYTIGYYSVAIVVNGGNTVNELTREQVRDIFSGEIKNWKEVGGPDAPVHLYIRDPISGTYLGFQEVAMEKKPYALELKTATSYAGITEAVSKDPGGIGYSSIELATRPGIKGVSIAGVAPTIENVKKGQYPYSRSLRFYTNKAHETAAPHDFIQFVLSPSGQAVMDQMGFVPR